VASILIVRDYERATAANSFDELWHSLSNDELFELRMIFQCATGRSLMPLFNGATPEDWDSMRRVLGHLERLVRRVNSLIGAADWDDEPLVRSLLVRAEVEDRAANEAPEYLAIANELYKTLRDDSFYGGGGKLFADRSLFAFQKVPELPTLDGRSYDIFISYKTSRHASDAQRLADRLIAKEYSVWFDKYVLDRLESRPQIFETEHLLAILRHAVEKSSCTIIYEGMMHAALLAPGQSEEKLLNERQLMRVNTAPVIWDWHGIEIAAAEWGITIHPNTIAAFHQQGGKVLWSTKHAYSGESQRDNAIDAALRAVADARAQGPSN
jgi:hypothetical protein